MPVISVSVAATMDGFDALARRIEEATRQLTADAAHLVQVESMKEAPVGVAGNSTNMPGDLRRSIDVSGPLGADGVYTAEVGPTVIYGRQRELGGDIYPRTARALAFTKFGTRVYTMHVYQEANPYMRRGEEHALPLIEAVAQERIAEAILGR